MNALAIDDDLAGARTGVVVRAHHESVGARGEYREEITGRNVEIAVAREEIAALADGPDDLPAARDARCRHDGFDVVPRIVERRADEIVHCGVDDRVAV